MRMLDMSGKVVPLRRRKTRRRGWLLVRVLLAIALMVLLGFGLAVRHAVFAAEARRAVAATHAHGMWLCSGERGRGLRLACEQQLQADASQPIKQTR